jgi:hypothetical protein
VACIPAWGWKPLTLPHLRTGWPRPALKRPGYAVQACWKQAPQQNLDPNSLSFSLLMNFHY